MDPATWGLGVPPDPFSPSQHDQPPIGAGDIGGDPFGTRITQERHNGRNVIDQTDAFRRQSSLNYRPFCFRSTFGFGPPALWSVSFRQRLQVLHVSLDRPRIDGIDRDLM